MTDPRARPMTSTGNSRNAAVGRIVAEMLSIAETRRRREPLRQLATDRDISKEAAPVARRRCDVRRHRRIEGYPAGRRPVRRPKWPRPHGNTHLLRQRHAP
jgi:hypothetical protein